MCLSKKTRSDLAFEAHPDLPKEYKRVERYTDFCLVGRMICEGSHRESIIVDRDSPKLDHLFNEFLRDLVVSNTDTQPDDEVKEELKPSEDKIVLTQQPHELLDYLVSYVSKYFEGLSKEEEMSTVVSHYYKSIKKEYKSKKESTVPLDFFVESKAAMCRHKALLTACLLSRLINHSEHEGSSQVFRFRSGLEYSMDSTKSVGHAVVVFQSTNGKRYLIDPTRKTKIFNGIVIDLSDLSNPKEKLKLDSYKPFNGVKFAEEINAVYDSLKEKVPRVSDLGLLSGKKRKREPLPSLDIGKGELACPNIT